MLPAQYRWLEAEPGPRMIVEALKEYGTIEAPGEADNPKIVGWQAELEDAGLGRVYAGVYRHDAIPWCGLFMAIVAHRANSERRPERNPPKLYAPPAPPVIGSAEILAGIEAFVAATGATIEHGGTVACYVPSRDLVRMPPRASFFATPTSSATEAYYSTELHELVHWTGPKGRCDRDLTGRFRSEAYAMEELVAELGAAFLSADLGITAEPRADHAQYLAHWLTVLKADKKAIFTAASAASRAVQFLHGLQAA